MSNILLETYPELKEDGGSRDLLGGGGRVFRIANEKGSLVGQKITNTRCRFHDLEPLEPMELLPIETKSGGLIREVGLTSVTHRRIYQAREDGILPRWIRTVDLGESGSNDIKDLLEETIFTGIIPKEVFPGISLRSWVDDGNGICQKKRSGSICQELQTYVYSVLRQKLGILAMDIASNLGNILVDREARDSLNSMTVFDSEGVRGGVCVNHDTTLWKLLDANENEVTDQELGPFAESVYHTIREV